ncbi:MAG: hypothetical protein ACYC48_02030 [Minisyncoccota bacterium]
MTDFVSPNLSRETIEEFRQIIKEEYGVEYTDMEAWEAAHNLVGFFDLLARLDYKQKQKENEGEVV